MKKIYLLFCLVVFSDCSIFQREETSFIQPKLLKQTALPPIRQLNFNDRYEFYCELVINENGDVEKAKILRDDGDALWDSLATISILTWKFSPAIMNGQPFKFTTRRKFIVMCEKPTIISLAEIQLNNISTADSVYKALIDGSDFSELALKYSISTSRDKKGIIGSTDIKHYSKDISNYLTKLHEGEFTVPIKYGEYFIIFKRLIENK